MRISQWKVKLIITVAYLGVVTLFYVCRIPCVFQSFLGIICPGCGMTRAIRAALQLDFAAAFQYHPMFWSIPLLYLYFLLDNGLFPGKRWDRILLIGIAAGFVINWLVRL